MTQRQEITVDIDDLANDRIKLQVLIDEYLLLKKQEVDFEKQKETSEKAQQLLRDAIANLDDGFVIYDKEDRLVISNEAFRSQFGGKQPFYRSRRHI